MQISIPIDTETLQDIFLKDKVNAEKYSDFIYAFKNSEKQTQHLKNEQST